MGQQDRKTLERAFERNIERHMPKWALMHVVAETKKGNTPAGIPDYFKRRFLRMATVFGNLVEDGVFQIKPQKFRDHLNPYEFPNYRLVRGRTKPSRIEIKMHPLVAQELSYGAGILRSRKEHAESHLAMTIVGTVRFYTKLQEVMATNAKKNSSAA